jgi:hypothetical protein
MIGANGTQPKGRSSNFFPSSAFKNLCPNKSGDDKYNQLPVRIEEELGKARFAGPSAFKIGA